MIELAVMVTGVVFIVRGFLSRDNSLIFYGIMMVSTGFVMGILEAIALKIDTIVFMIIQKRMEESKGVVQKEKQDETLFSR